MTELQYRNGYDFGVGVDTITGAPMGDPIRATEIQEMAGAEGQNVIFTMQRVDSTEQLTEIISASADMSARYGFFSGSASFDFSKEASVNKYSMFLVVSVLVTNAFRQIRRVELAPHAVELWQRGDPEVWRQAMGDRYCRGVTTGGILNVMLRIESESEEHREEISAKIQAGMNVGVGGFDAKAQFSNMMSNVASTTNISLSHLQSGGDKSIEYTPDKIMEQATHFADSVSGNLAVPFTILASPYETAVNLPQQPNKFDLRHQKDVIRDCGRLRLKYLDWLSDIEYVLSHPKQFDWKGQEKAKAREIDKKADAIRKALNLVASMASTCSENAMQCEFLGGKATVIDPADLLPPRKRKKAKDPQKPTPGPGAVVITGLQAKPGVHIPQARNVPGRVNNLAAQAIVAQLN